MFTIGQKVICIDGKSSVCGVRLIDNEIYTVKNIWRCKCSDVIDVGLRISTTDKCFKCNKQLSSDGTWWLFAKRFVPIDEWKIAEGNVEQLKKILEEPAWV